MAIIPRQMLCPASKKSLKFPYAMTPTRIVVHNTASDASADSEIKYMNSNNKEVSYHFAIDEKEVVQGLPLNVNSWNAGDGHGKGNREGIAIEICRSKSGGERFIAAEKLAAKFIAQLLKERNWGIDKVTKHQDYNGKYCPHRTLDMGWERFLNMIKVEMGLPVVVNKTQVKVGDLVRLSSDAQYSTGKAVPVWVKNLKWYVKEVKGDRIVLGKSEDGKNDINSPVDAKYVTVVTKTAAATKPAEATKPAATTKPTVTAKPAVDPKKKKITEWQKAAIADGFKFPKYGADGSWGAESEAVAKKAICKKQLVYKNKNLTKFLQGQLGITADGKFGANTKTAVINYQKKNKLTADGAVGLNTWKKILGV